ncbi:hypothetical protein VNO77_01289 [Canavalia gladiata]|uniref:Uncharacterized protein n=1 Tax=Canavalia gladiata TaxID=3824 RepID=A0AAN9MVN2_CANGL
MIVYVDHLQLLFLSYNILCKVQKVCLRITSSFCLLKEEDYRGVEVDFVGRFLTRCPAGQAQLRRVGLSQSQETQSLLCKTGTILFSTASDRRLPLA